MPCPSQDSDPSEWKVMCSCLSFPLSPFIQTFIYHPKPETWGLIYSLQNVKKCGVFFFISRSSMRQGRSICQLLIFPHSIYICILSFCDCHLTSPPDILLDKNGKLWPHWRQEEFGYRFPWKSNFKQWPGSLHRPVPRLSACRGPSPSSHSTFIFLLSSSRSSSEILIRISNRLERCEPWY